MDSVTETILDEEVPQARLGLLLKHFSQFDDAREPWRVKCGCGVRASLGPQRGIILGHERTAEARATRKRHRAARQVERTI
jgi:hypothetical protein